MLSAVSVAEIVEALERHLRRAASSYGERLVETYMIGAMSPEHALRYFQLTPNKVVIVGGDRAEIILTALDTPTVAVVLTGNYVPSPAVLERAEERGVPLVSVETDTVTAADGLRRLFGRLRVKERAKIDLIAELIDEAVDLDRLVRRPAGMRGDRGRPYTSPHEVTAAWSAIAGDRVVRVVVDAAGGDNAPDEVVEGALEAAGPQLHVDPRRRRGRACARCCRRACSTSASCTPPT